MVCVCPRSRSLSTSTGSTAPQIWFSRARRARSAARLCLQIPTPPSQPAQHICMWELWPLQVGVPTGFQGIVALVWLGNGGGTRHQEVSQVSAYPGSVRGPRGPCSIAPRFAVATDKTETQLGFQEEKEQVEQKPRKVSESQVGWLHPASPPGSLLLASLEARRAR